MKFYKILIFFACYEVIRCQYYSGGSYHDHKNFPLITTSKEGLQTTTNEVMELNSEKTMDEGNKIDFASEVLLKIALAILAYKALAFNLVLFALIVIIPILNPMYFDYSRKL